MMLPQQYHLAAEADNTRTAHAADLARFYRWGGTVPATVELVCAYVTEHAETHRVSTIERWMASISVEHRRQGLISPTRHQNVKKALDRVREISGTVQRRVSPLYVEQVKAIVDSLKESVADKRNKALVLVAFSGAMRGSEVAGLNVDSFRFDPRGMQIYLGRTKFDAGGFNSGVTILAAAKSKYCPVLAIQEWLSLSGIAEGPVFRAVNRHGGIGTGPLTIQGLEKIVKSLAARVGLDASGYSGHSLRAGLVTSAVRAGKPIHKILDITSHANGTSHTSYLPDAEKYNNSASDLF